MIRIGDFSRLTGVTVKALRHYDTVGLFAPAFVDEESGYRYYRADQLPDLHRILALKDAGFSLDEIKALQARQLRPAEVKAMLEAKHAEICRHIAGEALRLERLTARLMQWERKQKMPEYEVIIKKVDAVLVAGVHETIPDWESVSPTFNRIFDEVYACAGRNGAVFTGPAMDLWLDTEHKDTDMQVEACAPIATAIPESGRVKVHTLPAVETMACVIHRGPFAGLHATCEAVIGWIDDNGYDIDGPLREVYVQYDREGDPEQYVTEVQFPVKKR